MQKRKKLLMLVTAIVVMMLCPQRSWADDTATEVSTYAEVVQKVSNMSAYNTTGTIKLMSDLTVNTSDYTASIYYGDITIDLNGHTITFTETESDRCVFNLQSEGKLTLKNGTINITADNTNLVSCGGNSVLNIESGVYSSKSNVIVSGSYSTTNITGPATIVSEIENDGCVVMTSHSTLNITSNATIRNEVGDGIKILSYGVANLSGGVSISVVGYGVDLGSGTVNFNGPCSLTSTGENEYNCAALCTQPISTSKGVTVNFADGYKLVDADNEEVTISSSKYYYGQVTTLKVLSCGTVADSDIDWSLEDGALTLTCDGPAQAMPDFTSATDVPWDASKVEKIYIDPKITTIGKYAFANCTKLTEMYIGSQMTSIGDYAFSGCTSLASVYCNYNNPTLGTDALPEDAEYHVNQATGTNWSVFGLQVSSETFWTYRTEIKSLTLTDDTSVSCINNVDTDADHNLSIGQHLAYNHGNLDLTLRIFDDWGRDCQLTGLAEKAFNGCSVATVKLPETVKVVGASAFTDCYNLSSITFKSVPSFGDTDLSTYGKSTTEVKFALNDNSYIAENTSVSGVTSSTYTRTMTTRWGTFIVPFDVAIDESVAMFYTIDQKDGDVIVLKELSTLAAGTPAIVYSVSGTGITVTSTGNTINTAINNITGGTIGMYGVYTWTKVTDPNSYYFKGDHFYQCNGSFYAGAFRGYFTSESTISTMEVKEETTALLVKVSDGSCVAETANFQVKNNPRVKFIDGKAVMYYGSDANQTHIAELPMENGAQLRVSFKDGDYAEADNVVPSTVSSVGYSTLYSAFQMKVPAGVEVYAPTYSKGSSSIKLTDALSEGSVIPACTGLVLKGDEGSYNFTYTASTKPLTCTSVLKGFAIDLPKGFIESGTIYTLAQEDDEVAFYKYDGYMLGARKAYLLLDDSDNALAKIGFSDIDEEEVPMGVEKIENSELENENPAVYNILGQRVSDSAKGLVIKNGCKYYNK